jgi:lipopolysaccharide cholinephosphotransferase
LNGGVVYRNSGKVADIQYVNVLNSKGVAHRTVLQLKKTNTALSESFYSAIGNSNKHNFFLSLPKAAGLPRIKQLVYVYWMRLFDTLCERLNVEYWLDSGCLLGAVRNGGFISWDDDLDVVVKFSDLETLEEYCRSNRQFDDLPKLSMWFSRYSRKVGLPEIYADELGKFSRIELFPFTYCDENTEEAKSWLKDFRIEAYQRSVDTFGAGPVNDSAAFMDFANEYVREVRSALNGKNSEEFLIGTLFSRSGPHILPTKACFPLRRIDFEGQSLSCPNDPDVVLEKYYGDYWKLPTNMFTRKHVGNDRKLILRSVDFVKKYDRDFYERYILKELG